MADLIENLDWKPEVRAIEVALAEATRRNGMSSLMQFLMLCARRQNECMLLDTEALYGTCFRTLTVANLSAISMEIEVGS